MKLVAEKEESEEGGHEGQEKKEVSLYLSFLPSICALSLSVSLALLPLLFLSLELSLSPTPPPSPLPICPSVWTLSDRILLAWSLSFVSHSLTLSLPFSLALGPLLSLSLSLSLSLIAFPFLHRRDTNLASLPPSAAS